MFGKNGELYTFCNNLALTSIIIRFRETITPSNTLLNIKDNLRLIMILRLYIPTNYVWFVCS